MASVLDQIEEDATPTVAHADVCVDGRLLADYLDAREQMAGSKKSTRMLEDADLETLTARFKALHEQVVAKTRRYTFTCMDRAQRQALQDKHTPTPAQAKKGFEWNPATYEPALAGATLLEINGEPVEDDVERRVKHFETLYRNLPEGEHGWGIIAKAVTEANFQGTQVPKFVRDIGDQFVSELSSTTPQNGASPSASSEGE